MRVEAAISTPLFDDSPHHSPSSRTPSKRSSSKTMMVPEMAMTELYRQSWENDWESVASILVAYPEEARYVHSDGTTALHMAVMSRTGYVINEEIQQRQAPLEIIEGLLQVYPDAAMKVCRTNTYSPLAYACLVVEKDCDLTDAEAIVRLLLKYSPLCTKVTTSGSLSALDIHIVSYSQKHQDVVEEDPLSGRTNTGVLRTLLEHDPSLAKVRIARDKVSGAIELLYRSNANAFLEVVSLDDIKKRTKRRTSSEPQDNKAVISEITKWWVWRWVILLLKYGTLPHKKRGARFFALQSAAGLVGCPLPVLTLAMHAFPKQIRLVDVMYGDDGNLPLHEVCAWPCEYDCTSTDPVISSRKGMAIAALLQEYPEAAGLFNRHSQTPLELAVSTGTTWDIGVRKLCRAYPDAVCRRSKTTGLYPFMTAAVAGGEIARQQCPMPSSKRSLMTHLKNLAKQDLQSVRTIYGLLRTNPLVLISCFTQNEDACDELTGFSPLTQELWASININDDVQGWTQF
jgi:hypothetical protein